jgi:hypothetical protein
MPGGDRRNGCPDCACADVAPAEGDPAPRVSYAGVSPGWARGKLERRYHSCSCPPRTVTLGLRDVLFTAPT